METSVEKDCSALGGLFQIVINDMKAGVPMWEDFLTKATKLHSQLKATVIASTAFLDAFQKVADLATSTKGATKDIGTALTRLCLRHRSVEARLKTFTSSIIDCLVLPLQDKIEDWKKTANQLDKDHSKEYKRARQEIKKKSSDTLRLQKKVRKGKGDFQRSFDCALQDVSDKYLLLEETEKQAVRKALIEERSHFCLLVSCLKPVVEEELSMLQEITHLQEIVDALSKLTADPYTLPLASEQVIADIKGSDSSWSFQTPPSSPSSLGSRKSSMCSISSFNSSSSGSSKSHSPSHHYRHRSLSQQPVIGALRLSSISSQDSGFTSQDTLFSHLPIAPAATLDLANEVSSLSEHSSTSTSSTSSIPSSPYTSIHSVTGTWPNLQDTVQFERAAMSLMMFQRPHTISTAYERAGHNRPPLTSETFHPPDDDFLRGPNADDCNVASSEESLTGSVACTENLANNGTPENPPAKHKEPLPPLPSRSIIANEKPLLPDKPIPLKPEPPSDSVPVSSNSEDFHVYANAADISATSTSKLKTKCCTEEPEKQIKKLSQQKEFTALLTQSLRHQLQQNQRRDSEGNLFVPECRAPNDDKNQSLSDSEEMASLSKSNDYFFLESMSEYMEQYGVVLRNGVTNSHRPVSVPPRSESTGVSVGNINPQEKYGSLHRSASQTNKPPPPVRRNSSLSTTSLNNSPTALKSATLQRSSSPASVKQDPAIAISPGLVAERTRRFKQNEEVATVGGGKEVHVQNQNGTATYATPENCQPSVAIVPIAAEETKTFTSHAQFIQTLNARLAQQPTLSPRMLKRRSLSLPHGPQSGEWLREVVSNAKDEADPLGSQEPALETPAESSVESSKSASPNSSRKFGGHAHTLNSCERESLIQSLNAKFSQRPPGGTSKLQRKPSAPNALPQRERTAGSYSPPVISQRRASQPNLALKQPLQVYRANGSDDEKYDAPKSIVPSSGERISRQNFLEALNAKLAQQHSQTLPVRRGSSVDRYESSKRSGDCCPKQDPTHAKEGRAEACGATKAAARVHSWLAGRGTVDIASCRESLMDQIRQGATLRKATSNDRSAPKLS